MHGEFLEKDNPYFAKQCKNRLKIDKYTTEKESVCKNVICMIGIHLWSVPGVSSDGLVSSGRAMQYWGRVSRKCRYLLGFTIATFCRHTRTYEFSGGTHPVDVRAGYQGDVGRTFLVKVNS